MIATLDAMIEKFGGNERPNIVPRWNIAPTQSVSVITEDTKGRHIRNMRWGFQGPNNAPLINARAETVARLPSFRESFQLRRCLVPADGFYEWQQLDEKRKQPWRIGMKGGGLFAFAGLWESATDRDGIAFERFTIVTTTANDYLLPLHERMPVILAPQDYAHWLAEPTAGLLRPYPAEPMARYRVTNKVNNVKNDGPECFERLVSAV